MVTHTSIIGNMYKALMAHVRGYVEPQYGEYDEGPISGYSVKTCVEHAQRYMARFGRSSRPGEEHRDLVKAAHYIACALEKLKTNEHAIEKIETPSFTDAPQSIGEIKVAKTRRAQDWTPRDAITALLRQHDSGERKLVSLVVGYSYDADNETEIKTSYYAASPNLVTTMGILELTKFNVERDAFHD